MAEPSAPARVAHRQPVVCIRQSDRQIVDLWRPPRDQPQHSALEALLHPWHPRPTHRHRAGSVGQLPWLACSRCGTRARRGLGDGIELGPGTSHFVLVQAFLLLLDVARARVISSMTGNVCLTECRPS